MKKPLLIGIAGGSASGKTSVATTIFEHFKKTKSVVIIRQDDYYLNQDHMTMEERVKMNYDHPMAFDYELMHVQLKQLIHGETIAKPIYDFKQHTRSKEKETVSPVDVIIIEGLFVLEDESIRSLLDLKLFVDTDADVRFIRRLERDINERGRSIESVIKQYQESVRPMHIQFLEPTKRYADVIIPEGKSNTVAIDLIITKVSSIIGH